MLYPELTELEFNAIKKFATGLKGCIVSKSKAVKDENVMNIISYVLSLVDLHLSLAELDFEVYTKNQEKYFSNNLEKV